MCLVWKDLLPRPSRGVRPSVYKRTNPCASLPVTTAAGSGGVEEAWSKEEQTRNALSPRLLSMPLGKREACMAGATLYLTTMA